MRVAQTGIRGIPANFGGSETAVEEIGCTAQKSCVESGRPLLGTKLVVPSPR